MLKLVAPDRKFPHKTFMIFYLFETLYILTPAYKEKIVLDRWIDRQIDR